MDFERILKKYKPEDFSKEIEEFKSKVEEEIKRQGIDADVFIGGSYAKNTHLKGFDIDVFIRFDYSYKDEKISDIAEKILKKCFKDVERLKGSRDYFKVNFYGKDIEVVPILKIDKAEKALNITDISPLHVSWVKRKIESNAKLSNEIRLAKLFLKANNLYGAESYIRGFSGYVIEILIIYYGSFMNFIKKASSFKPKLVIDPERYYRNKKEIFSELSESKLKSPIIIIDPVQKTRNAAAALSYEKFNKLILLAKKFLKKPSIKFFEKQEFNVIELRKKASRWQGEFNLLRIKPIKDKEDIVGAKLLQTFEWLLKQIKNNDFHILDADWFWDKKEKALFYFITIPKKQSAFKRHEGPPIYSENADKFLNKYKDIVLEGPRIYAIVKRKYRTVKALLKELVKSDYVRERVMNVKI